MVARIALVGAERRLEVLRLTVHPRRRPGDAAFLNKCARLGGHELDERRTPLHARVSNRRQGRSALDGVWT